MISALMAQLWELLPILYVAALYGVSRLATLRGKLRHVVVIDALMLNWLACEIARQTIPGQQLPAAYMCIDIVSALWLSLRVRGKVAAIAEIFYIALIIFNAGFFFGRIFNEWTHWIGLSILSWFQLAGVLGGILRHELVELTGRAASRLGVQRYMAFGSKETEE